MRIRALKIDTKLIPEWCGNRDLPAHEQMVIHFHRIPGTSEKGNYESFSCDSAQSYSVIHRDNTLVAHFVSRIENLELEVGGEVKKITKGIDLAAASHPKLGELFSEIRLHLFPVDEDLSPGESIA